MATRLFSHSWTDVPAVDLQQRTSIKATLEPPGHLFARLASPAVLLNRLLSPLLPSLSSTHPHHSFPQSFAFYQAQLDRIFIWLYLWALSKLFQVSWTFSRIRKLDTSFGSVPSKQQPQAEQQIYCYTKEYVISAVPDLQHHPSYHL
ncbi:hypothetical protein HBI12_055570 [Parastagonospora nodorum]|nr:hypothetical protein HBI12_055570 [Parastagonospora nodorum]